ncbi:MAG: biotin--[acetyl-CoA-carboxylase] ligase [Candidatus Odinarchaeota archaeon]|nr:biotin--[acetyl-CoA-carboxylase] ligase [Candidatus Odinarchaeota archaeon]
MKSGLSMSSQQYKPIERITRKARKIGCCEFVYDILDSTMTRAKELAEKNFPEGTVVAAKEQTQGKGRNGRLWMSPRGGLWLSIIFRPRMDISYMFIFSYMISLSVAEAIQKLGLNPKIKWPNDVLVEGKKIAGILIDTKSTDIEVEYIIAGIGINVNNKIPRLPENSIEGTSIKEHVGRKVDIEQVKRYLYDSLEKNYSTVCKSKEDYIEIFKKWDNFNFLKGRTVKIYDDMSSSSIQGKVIGVNYNTGGLIVKVDSKMIEVFDSVTIRT